MDVSNKYDFLVQELKKNPQLQCVNPLLLSQLQPELVEVVVEQAQNR